MSQQLADGMKPRAGYGFSHFNYNRDYAVFYIFPLNHLIAFLRRLWFKYRDSKQTELEKYQRLCRHYEKTIDNLSATMKSIKDKDEVLKDLIVRVARCE